MTSRPPLPPFAQETATLKVHLAEDGWNTRDPEDSRWRNLAEFPIGREQIVAFLTRKWMRELDYRLVKELWAFHGNRIAVRIPAMWDTPQHSCDSRSIGTARDACTRLPSARAAMLA